MASKAIFIREIFQKDNHSFVIEWTDGSIMTYRLSDLQKQCPCARCVDEISGERTLDPSSVDEDVRARTLRGVGRYALCIDFTTGCSSGIFSYDMLYAAGLQQGCKA